MKTLNEDIKTGNFKPVYLLYGEEAYLKKQYRDRITKAIFPDGDTVNYAYYEGKGINPGELIDLAETMPFFADRRLIVIENSGFFKNASPELADYIKTMPDTACFLFVENEADKRGKMYKAVKSKGRVVEMARQDEKTLLYWVAGNVKKEGYKIKEQTARYLLSTTGTDMENLEKELEKLIVKLEKEEKTDHTDDVVNEEVYETAAVIAMTEEEASDIYRLLENRGISAFYVDRDTSVFHKGLTVTTYYLAKGLEFDQVFVVKSKKENPFEKQALYISATRALHELYVYEE